MKIEYFVNQDFKAESFIDLLHRAEFAERRPVDNLDCINGMITNSNLIVTAWIGDLVIGAARSVTDFNYCCYLSDLVVDKKYQNMSIGKELIRQTRSQLRQTCRLILIAAPAAMDYYPKLGFEKLDRCWTII